MAPGFPLTSVDVLQYLVAPADPSTPAYFAARPVPEEDSMALMGVALVALAAIARKQRRHRGAV